MDTTRGTLAGPTSSGSAKVQATSTTAQAPKNMPAAWSAPAGGDSAAVVGSWLVNGKTIVRGDAGALKAYDTETGKALWTFQPPGQGATICAMSQLAAPNFGMVQYGPNGACTTVAAINTDTGKPLWNTTLTLPPGSAPGTLPAVSLDSEVTVWQVGTTVTAWASAGGKQLWTTDLAKAKPACRLGQFGSQDGSLALIEDCGTGPIVAMKDAHTGRDLWHTPLPPDGLQGAQITLVHTSPVMVHVTSQGAQPVDRYYSFDPSGKLLPPIDGNGDYGDLDLNVGSQGQQHPLADLQDNVFIAPTADKDANASLVAFDLTSGHQLWQAPATASGPVTVVALNQKWVTVFDGVAGGSGARLLAYQTSGGGPTTTGISKETLGPDWSGPVAAGYIAGDRVIVVPAAPEKGADVLAFTWGGGQ
ncbi:outer membrane protein assembly factor BamB family protein [Catenulispora pinisilvae]|uniref:outer membrane protein assembly factor BamB family protein n=1 Tax=Catenulispora pinisilvae TaxID=2705253 RepID=UPI001891BBF9|nr:PQQ-binding-like beta-propeller repeat protein [Catenulispora pinisilvae]